MMKWCCLGFEANYDKAGERGLGILVGRDSTGRAEFTLQFRAFDKGAEQSINSEHPISLVEDIGMRYCPWCGRDLETWYGDAVDSLYRPDLKITY
jgi:hypothetical protein